jgi:hypothetical protein
MTFSCGCTDAPATLSDYCREHWAFGCHTNGNPEQGECPPCRLARLRSVSLSSSATPTRGRKS